MRHASASSALCLAVPITEPSTHILSEQGGEINRPSTLYIEVNHAGGEISTVCVGGQIVLVAEGVVRF